MKNIAVCCSCSSANALKSTCSRTIILTQCTLFCFQALDVARIALSVQAFVRPACPCCTVPDDFTSSANSSTAPCSTTTDNQRSHTISTEPTKTVGKLTVRCDLVVTAPSDFVDVFRALRRQIQLGEAQTAPNAWRVAGACKRASTGTGATQSVSKCAFLK